MGDGDPGAYDPEDYFRRVVRPLRQRLGHVPVDLLVRYAMPPVPPVLAAERLAAHLTEVLKDWESRVEETREGEVYKALLTGHEELVGNPDVDLWSPGWWADYAPPSSVDEDEGLSAPVLASVTPVAVAPVARRSAPVVGDVVGDIDVGVGVGVERDSAAEADPEPTELGLVARRVGEEVELRWSWPSWGRHADVSWREGHVRVSRNEFKERGSWRRAMSGLEFEVDVVVRGRGADTLAGSVVVAPRRQEVAYAVRRVWWKPGSKTYELTFTADQPPVELCTVEIGFSTERVMPLTTRHLTLLGAPFAIGGGSVRHRVTVPDEARWLRCFLVPDVETVDLLDPDVDRLRVQRWPR